MKTVILAVFAAGCCTAQIPASQQTEGYLNGRFWRALDHNERLHFVIGYMEHWGWSENATTTSSKPRATMGELTTGIDKVYEAPENGQLPIAVALAAFNMRLIGKSEAEVAEFLRKIRAIYNPPQ